MAKFKEEMQLHQFKYLRTNGDTELYERVIDNFTGDARRSELFYINLVAGTICWKVTHFDLTQTNLYKEQSDILTLDDFPLLMASLDNNRMKCASNYVLSKNNSLNAAPNHVIETGLKKFDNYLSRNGLHFGEVTSPIQASVRIRPYNQTFQLGKMHQLGELMEKDISRLKSVFGDDVPQAIITNIIEKCTKHPVTVYKLFHIHGNGTKKYVYGFIITKIKNNDLHESVSSSFTATTGNTKNNRKVMNACVEYFSKPYFNLFNIRTQRMKNMTGQLCLA